MEIWQDHSVPWQKNGKNITTVICTNYLFFEKKPLETLINKMHDQIIGLDNDSKILFVNDKAIKIIGMKQEEV